MSRLASTIIIIRDIKRLTSTTINKFTNIIMCYHLREIEPIKTSRVSLINILAKLVKSKLKSINYEHIGKYYHHSR